MKTDRNSTIHPFLLQTLTALLFVSMLTMTITSCSADDNKKIDIDFNSEVTGEITVATFYTNDQTILLTNIARLFEKKYPGTKVNVVPVMQPFDTVSEAAQMVNEQDINDYITRTSTEFMTGKGADILKADMLPWIKYADANQLVDISELMKNDPDFVEDDYRTFVFDAMKYKGSLYTVPINYSFRYVNYNKTMFSDEQVKAAGFDVDKLFTYAELKNLANQANTPEGAVVFDVLGPDELLNYLFYNDYYQYIDYENKKPNFIDGKFEKLLEQCMDDYQKHVVLDPAKYERDLNNVNKLINSDIESVSAFDFPYMNERYRYYYYQLEMRGFGKMWTISHQKGEDDAIAGMLKSDNGKVNVYTQDPYFINASSPNKRLAWEFLKYVLSEDIQTAYLNRQFHQPINKKSDTKTMELRFVNLISLNDEMTKLVEAYMDEYQHMIDTMAPMTNQYVIYDRFIDAAIITESRKFFEGKATAKDVCQTLQNKIDLYLNE